MRIEEVRQSIRLGQKRFTLTVESDGERREVPLPPGIPDKGQVTDALIRLRYSQADMEALANNIGKVLLTAVTGGPAESDEALLAEYMAMQDYRTACKRTAEDISCMIDVF